MKIFIANPPWRDPDKDDRYGVRAGSRWPHFEAGFSNYVPFPFFLAYTAAVLEQDGFDIQLGDSIAARESEAVFLDRVERFAPDLLLLETSTPSIGPDLALCDRLKKRFPALQIAVAGPHHEMYAPEFLDAHPHLDLLLLGEYEYTARDLARALAAGTPLSGVAGLIFRDPVDGRAVQTPRRVLIENLDELPFPARHLLPMDRYCDTPGGIPTPSLQIIASRGCPFQCIFCSWPQIMYGSHRYRTRSASNILDEIEACQAKYAIRSIYFDDDTFNIGEGRILEICDEFIRRGIQLPWAAMARADTMTEPMLTRMKEAGLTAIKYGVESASQEILDRSKKRLDLKKAEEIIRLTKRMGIKVHLTFCFGLPGETKDTINRTIDYSIALDPDTVQYSIVTPYPGSEYFETLAGEGRIRTRNWSEYDGSSQAVFETESLTRADLARSVQAARSRWTRHAMRKDFFSKFLFYLREALKKPFRALFYLWRILFSPRHV